MRIGVVGINFKSAPLEIREALAKACQYCFSPSALSLRVQNTVLLSTCNRTEIYFSSEDLAEMQTQIIAALREFVTESFEQKLYSFFGVDCFLHLAKVAAGLDSAILAETEIQQQVRSAYKTACQAQVLTAPLHFLFQKTFKISKAIRSAFPLPRGLPSLETVLFELMIQTGIEQPPKVLFIGNSYMNRKILRFFHSRGCTETTLCTRSVQGIGDAAETKTISMVGWEALSSWRRWDVVICATHQSGYLLRQDHHGSSHRHLLIDLSIPRLIDPALERDPMNHLLNMEEIAAIVDGRRRHLLQQVDASQAALENSVLQYLERFQEKRARRSVCVGF
ncbi:MAG: glutamyl-tRNA reductase [Simkania sp.]|nr:glutamyl-tRNA reductase [Simkania sp.]